MSKTVDLGESPDEIIKRLRDEGLLENSLEIIACNEEDALTIAKLRPLTKSAGCSYYGAYTKYSQAHCLWRNMGIFN